MLSLSLGGSPVAVNHEVRVASATSARTMISSLELEYPASSSGCWIVELLMTSMMWSFKALFLRRKD